MLLNTNKVIGWQWVVAMVLVMALLAGCTEEASEEQVAPMVEEYFATLEAKDYDKLLTFYHDDFFNLQTKQEWLDHLNFVRATLGEIQNIKLKQKQVNTVFSGRRFIYEYSLKYEKGFAKETVMFFQEINTDVIKVHMHKIDSNLLKKAQG